MTVTNNLNTLFQLQAIRGLSTDSTKNTNTSSSIGMDFLTMLAMQLESLGVDEQEQFQKDALNIAQLLPNIPTNMMQQLNNAENGNVLPNINKTPGNFGYKHYDDMTFGMFTKPYQSKYDSIINEMGKKYDVDPKLIKSIIKHESDFNTNTVSHAGAAGLMQLMPSNAAEFNISDRFDPRQNIEGGTREIKRYLDRYDGNLTLALAAYNAGPGNVKKYGGVPPFKETQNYIRKIFNSYY